MNTCYSQLTTSQAHTLQPLTRGPSSPLCPTSTRLMHYRRRQPKIPSHQSPTWTRATEPQTPHSANPPFQSAPVSFFSPPPKSTDKDPPSKASCTFSPMYLKPQIYLSTTHPTPPPQTQPPPTYDPYHVRIRQHDHLRNPLKMPPSHIRYTDQQFIPLTSALTTGMIYPKKPHLSPENCCNPNPHPHPPAQKSKNK
ncbi:hypothetical protein CHS0354_008011 [Potamilus streckersoni]|uniref:Uncharacterized protein n=1 Tax=Potamilus streckersoni TaxID=2493646 RepID=A0AAE0TE17_9BIVA|nr:hypothetical protein CHS0354_008011 [Potamilus streckersoni]